ncbi:AAA family ATPase [Mycobacteroides chelonae]
MRLVSFTVRNYRRFVEPTSVKVHGDLVALIGPNEAGKSSVLRALSLLNSDEPFRRSDEHRRSGISPQLDWGFQLDNDDKRALAEIPEAAALERVVLTKGQDGLRQWSFHPGKPVRDREPRRQLHELIELFLGSPAVDEAPRNEDNDFRDSLHAVLGVLQLDVDDLGADAVNLLAMTGTQIETLDMGFRAEEHEADGDLADDLAHARSDILLLRDQLARALNEQAHRESGQPPAATVQKILQERLPKMIAYTQEDRDLRGSYDLEEVAESPPPALGHLRFLAGLDLLELRNEIREGLRADVATRRDRANRTLQDAFNKSWNQQKVALQIDVDGSTLFVHAVALDALEAGASDLSERSDGMRWFASLLAFVHGWGGKPILLVDEIETHLHYDAQADLVNVLARQEFTEKVIYTTHSFGCLPPDIGSGIRLVEPVDETTSRLANGFWRNGVGFSPLLTSMGAAAVSFTPSRHAVIVEGPSDAILLPTLLRQACGSESGLGFQIAPGVAEVATARASGLTAEAGLVVFLVDGDEGGVANRQKLIDGGIDADHIVVLVDGTAEDDAALETEDLVDVATYLTAVNDELACWNVSPLALTAADLGSTLRTKTLLAWCAANGLRAPDKVAVAERVIAMSTEQLEPVFEASRQHLLTKLRTDFGVLLGI